MAAPPLRLVRDAHPDEPGLDTSLSRALLLDVSAGTSPETFRLNRTGRVVAFGKRDTLGKGYRDAVAVARRRGYEAVERLAGGRAAVFHEGTLAFSWAIPDAAPRERITERFETLAGLIVRSLRRLGVAAAVGEVPGEYCPGAYSVHITGPQPRKVMGVGQRLARGGAHVGGVVVATGSGALGEILDPVYAALGLDHDRRVAGAVADADPSVTLGAVEAAILDELAAERDLVESRVSPATLARARALAAEHVSPA